MSSDRRDIPEEGDVPEESDVPAGRHGSEEPAGTAESAEGLGLVGWLLVGVVFVAFLLVPGVIYLYPVLLGTFGLSFFATYLVLPLIPAIGLGLVGVWLLLR